MPLTVPLHSLCLEYQDLTLWLYVFTTESVFFYFARICKVDVGDDDAHAPLAGPTAARSGAWSFVDQKAIHTTKIARRLFAAV